MSATPFVAPPPGAVTAVIPVVGEAASGDATPVLAAAAACGRRFARARATIAEVGQLSAATRLAAERRLPAGSAFETWLHPLPELRARLDRPWHELTHAERYLTQIAQARLIGVDLLLLELPSTWLSGPRVLQLVEDLARGGMGVLWLERRLRLVASFDIDAWLVDGDLVEGPLPTAGLLEDRRALSLCFGGRLAPS